MNATFELQFRVTVERYEVNTEIRVQGHDGANWKMYRERHIIHDHALDKATREDAIRCTVDDSMRNVFYKLIEAQK